MAGPVVAQTAMPEDLTAAVQLASDRGELLYVYDRAAWLGTDDFRDHYPSDLTGQVGGYVVSGDQIRAELVFFDKSKSKAVYRAAFAGGKLANNGPPAPDRTELSALEKQLIWAKDKGLEAFVEAKVGLCADAKPNLAALSPERPGGPIIVYMMTPQTDLSKFPLGGHFSVEVGQDGSVGKVRRFMNSCLEMKPDQVPKGAKPILFWTGHLLDPTPTEVHVFTSLASKMPIVVGTPNKRFWMVKGNSIQAVDPNKK